MVPLQLQLLINFITLYINQNIGYFKVIIIILQQVVKLLIFQCPLWHFVIAWFIKATARKIFNSTMIQNQEQP